MVPGERVFVIVDPAVREQDADRLRANGPMLRKMREGWTPPERPSSSARARAALTRATIGLAVAALGLVMLRSGHQMVGLLILAAVVLYTVVKTRWAVQPDDVRAFYDFALRQRGRYLVLKDFDREAWLLMTRTTDAVAAITGSAVNAAGLLDDIRNRVVLPAHEWEIAQLLAQLTTLRRERAKAVADGVAGAVVERMERALAASEEAIAGRVEALERYARHVAEADRAYRRQARMVDLQDGLHRYDDLAAASQADRLAVPEIEKLAHEADLLEDALRVIPEP